MEPHSRHRIADAEGFVLVGGKSTRFGRDKASFEVAGRPMALHVAAVLGALLETVTLVGDCRFRLDPGLPMIPDSVPGAGPLGGIVAALDHARRSWSVIAACDMPMANTAQLANLLEAAFASEAQAMIPRTPDGRLQPLFAAYHRSARAPLAQALHEGRLKLTRAIGGLRWSEVTVSDGAAYTNVNSLADARRLGGGTQAASASDSRQRSDSVLKKCGDTRRFP